MPSSLFNGATARQFHGPSVIFFSFIMKALNIT